MDKKTLRAEVEAKIETALAGFAKDVSDKKFKKHIKKAAKILGDGLTVSTPKKASVAKPVAEKPKAASKKVAVKKAKKAAGKGKAK